MLNQPSSNRGQSLCFYFCWCRLLLPYNSPIAATTAMQQFPTLLSVSISSPITHPTTMSTRVQRQISTVFVVFIPHLLLLRHVSWLPVELQIENNTIYRASQAPYPPPPPPHLLHETPKHRYTEHGQPTNRKQSINSLFPSSSTPPHSSFFAAFNTFLLLEIGKVLPLCCSIATISHSAASERSRGLISPPFHPLLYM